MKNTTDTTKILKEKIKNQDFGGLFIFTGEEIFSRQAAITAFTTHFEKDPLSQLNMLIFDDKGFEDNKVIEAANTFPVMSEQKLIVIKNSGIFKSASETRKKIFTDLFDNLPDFLTIIFDEDELDGRSSLLKKAKAVGLYTEFNYKTHAELVSYCGKTFKKENIEISSDVLSHFVFSCDDGLASVNTELDKLIAYSMDKKIVTKEDIDAIVKKSLKSRVFEMLDAMIDKKANVVFPILQEMKLCHEEPVKVIALIGRQAIFINKTCILLKCNSSDIPAQLGLKPFIAQKYIAQARKLGSAGAISIMNKCLEADLSIKRGETPDQTALELLVSDITSGNY